MESLESLKILCKLIPCTEVSAKEIVKNYEIIKHDLERLKELKEKVNHLKNVKNRWRRNCKFLEKENIKLKNQILSLELDTCIPELRKESEKLKEIISLLKLRLDIVGVDIENDFYFIDTKYGTRYAINKTEYDLLKEVFGK